MRTKNVRKHACFLQPRKYNQIGCAPEATRDAERCRATLRISQNLAERFLLMFNSARYRFMERMRVSKVIDCRER